MELSGDKCSKDKLFQYFSTKYTPVTSAKVADEGAYCTHLSHDYKWENVGVSLSDGSVAVLKRDTLQKTVSFKAHNKPIAGVHFSPTNVNLLWTGSLDATVKIWDIRTEKCEGQFETRMEDGNNAEEMCIKPITCFDVSLNERIVCAGTELVQRNAFLLFWDIRNRKLLGGYTDSHSDDITQVAFHPLQADTIATAATDGLMNVFDISQSDEDEALTYSLNVDVTVDKLTWLPMNGKYERLAAVTDIHSLQYWDIKESSPLHTFTREELTDSMKRESSQESYIVGVGKHHESDDPIVLVGSGMEESNCLRTLRVNLSRGVLEPSGVLQTKQEQRMTRASLYDSKTDSFITAGECGIVRAWNPEDNNMMTKQSVMKSKSHRKKPY